jgi:DNA/RNA endonuclease G (NUC1)
MNQHIWEDLERKVDHWADAYGKVWVICGPIINAKKPGKWIGEKGEVPVAVPDGFFKLVIKDAHPPLMLLRTAGRSLMDNSLRCMFFYYFMNSDFYFGIHFEC